MFTAEKARQMVADAEQHELDEYFNDIFAKITAATKDKEYSACWYHKDTAPIHHIQENLVKLGYTVVQKSAVLGSEIFHYLHIFWEC